MIQNHSYLLDYIKKLTINTDEYILCESKTGLPALKINSNGLSFFLSSKYNPENEAQAFVRNHASIADNILLYGLGMGYHIKEGLKALNDRQRLFILECNMNIVKIAFENTDIQNTLLSDKITFLASESLKEALDFSRLALEKPNSMCIIHEPSLRIMPEKLKEFKELFESFEIRYKTTKKFEPLLQDNFNYNTSLGLKNGTLFFKGLANCKPVIILAAGPSLELSLNELKSFQKKAIILAVARTSSYLEKVGIRPDCYIVTDAKESSEAQIKEIKDTSVPVIMLATANKGVTKYKGDKYIIHEKQSAVEAEKALAVETGGSVATTALGLASLSGAAPIVLLGQDLCYWSNKHHIGENGTYAIAKTNTYVKGTDGNTYYTTKNLNEYLRWFSRFAKKHPEYNIINCTKIGAEIEGIPHKELSEVFKDLPDIK